MNARTEFPDFYAQAPVVVMRDPLADFLGAARDGIVEYRYEDVVRLAGHSCPTVASAFLMARAALKALYGTDLPERGGIRVDLREPRDAGVAGVMGAVAGFVTGAADEGGFKGLGGRFVRCRRLFYGQEIGGTLRFARLDTGAAVETSVRLDGIPGDPRMMELLPRCLAGAASPEEAELFGKLWQQRVRSLLLDHADDPLAITVVSV